MNSEANKVDWADRIVKIGLAIKGLDSLLELIGGILFMFPQKVAYVLYAFAVHEAYVDHDSLAGKLTMSADSIESHPSIGQAAYLLVHGLSKVVLIYAVFKEYKWGYQGLIGVLSCFCLFEIVQGVMKHETMVLVLAAFDIALVLYMVKEYRHRFLHRDTKS